VTIEPDNARGVADFHTAFNLALAVVFFPLLTPYARLLRWLFPEKADPVDPSRPLYLDPAAREAPIVALGAAAREALRLADVLETMLQGACDALVQGDRKQISDTKRLDDVLDHLNTAIKTYLTALDPDELSEADHRRLNEIMIFSMNMEQAGDVVEQNLLPHAARRLKRGLSFSKEGEAELRAMMDRLIANLRTAASLFMTGDLRAARLLAEEKPAFRDAETAATQAHFERLRAGGVDTVETSTIYLDLLRNMKLINGHIVAAAAYPILERSGELLQSRIVTNASPE
jgi:phosphate:Na+ symporter